MELFRLIGRVMVENSDANKALSETGKLAIGATEELGEYLQKMNGWAAAAAAAFTASAIGKGMKEVWDMSSQVADIGDNVDKASQKFKLSREAYQEWAYVAERSGFSMEALGNSVVDLSKKVGSGSEDVMAALEEIGISAADAMTATPEELFDKVIAGLQAMDESTRRTFLADSLLGEGGKQLAPLLNMTAEETQALRDRIYDLRGVMSNDLVRSSAAYKDALTDLQEAMQGVKNELAENTLPAMEQTVGGLTLMLTGEFPEGLRQAADGIQAYFEGVAKSIGEFLYPATEATVSWMEEQTKKIADMLGFDYSEYAKEKATEDENGEPWWVAEGYDGMPIPGNADADVDGFSVYEYDGPVWSGRPPGFPEDFWNFSGSGLPYPAGDSDLITKLIDLRQQYLESGGSEWAFMAQTTEKYGAEVADQLIAALEESGGEVETATGAFTQAAEDAAKTWGEGTAKVSQANDAVVAAMREAAAGYAGLRPGQGLGGFGGNLADRFSHALGIPFVPRDEYPAKLHYGERVLTRQENQEYHGGSGSGGQNITIQIQSVAQSPAQEAAAITAALQRARWAT